MTLRLERAYAMYRMAQDDTRRTYDALLRAQVNQAQALIELQVAKEEKEREREVTT